LSCVLRAAGMEFAMEVLVVFLAVLGGWVIYTCVLVPYWAAS
jgi:hypothetical protein